MAVAAYSVLYLIFFVAYILLRRAAFRTSIGWGFIVLLVPFGSLIYSVKHWSEVGKYFLLYSIIGIVQVVMLFTIPSVLAIYADRNPGIAMLAQMINPDALAAARHGGAPSASDASGARPTPHEVRDLAEHDAPAPTAATPDPHAVQRAAYAKHAQELTTLYQQLDAERGKLQPGSPAVASFNAKAAKYQQAIAALTEEKSRLDALDGVTNRAAASASASPALAQAPGAARAECDRTTRQIQAIVNQTPPAVPKPPPHAEVYHYAFHPGANPPDYRAENLLATRELWKGQYVYMEDAPGVYYRSADCEFNPQTKCFYTSRNVPKKRLGDAEYQELTRLYRLLGQQQKALADAAPR